MQNQKTAPKQIDFAELPDLSVQEQRFVEALAEGCDNTEAYRRAYGAEGYSPPALRVKACRKAAQSHIQAHLDALRAVGLANCRLTLERRIEDEQAFAKRAELAGNFGAAGAAYDRINKLLGLYVEQFKDVSKDDPLAALNEIAKTSPDIAKQLALQSGIEWDDKGATRLN